MSLIFSHQHHIRFPRRFRASSAHATQTACTTSSSSFYSRTRSFTRTPPTMSFVIHSYAAALPKANLLDETIRRGLIPVSVFALFSVISTTALLLWITYRLVWRHDYRSQYVILIYNLLLGDLQQSLSFLISIHWLNLGRIDSPSMSCFAQGWLINMGDMSSGFFVLAIALHTWYSVVLGRKVSNTAFTSGIVGIWMFSLLLTFLGPALHGRNYFVRAGAWVCILLNPSKIFTY